VPKRRKQYAPDKRPDESWVEFQRRKYPFVGPPKQRDETWAQFEERQMKEVGFMSNGPIAFTRPGPRAVPVPPAATPPAAPPSSHRR
jgi:hypothetical protein